ncbi:hypothetical protein CC80DRAFT_534007 [Byssothecium circinans]|uniref:Uncharacterized protein n=1 Tax=Byssothecium circinans TaxID=147558 RepID=A0A6A5U2L6_9PLEO|nr:hypothetical protein CC80DRAFT_534007 [Byssothecium circinans]
MSQIKLPTENFFRFVDQIVASLNGFAEAWKVGNGSPTSKWEMEQILLRDCDTATIRSTSEGTKILIDNPGLYLFYRSKKLLDADPVLPNKVNEMMQYLYSELNTPAREKDAQLEKVCQLVMCSYDRRHLNRVFQWDIVPWKGRIYFNSRLNIPDEVLTPQGKLGAAIAVGATDLVKRLMDEFINPDSTQWNGDTMFGDWPLRAAALRGDSRMIDTINAKLSEMKAANVSSAGRQGFITHHQGKRFNGAFHTAIRTNDVGSIRSMWDLYLKHLKDSKAPLGPPIIDMWLLEAIRTERADIVRLVMGLPRLTNFVVSTANFLSACDTSNTALVEALIDHENNGMPINYLGNYFTPLVGAVRYGTLAIVNAVLDAGADVNLRTIPDNASAIEYALARRREDIARALLNKNPDLGDVRVRLVGSRSREFFQLLKDVREKQGYEVQTWEDAWNAKNKPRRG